MRLSRSDLEDVVKFLGDAAGLDRDDAYTVGLLHRLQELIPCDAMTYQEYEYERRRQCLTIGVAPEGDGAWEASADEPPDGIDALYWLYGPCPIVHHRVETASLRAVRLSDLTAARRFKQLPVYREYFRRYDIEHMLDIGLSPRASRQRSLILFREGGRRDFSARDRAVLELLRPHFEERERLAGARRQLIDELRSPPNGHAPIVATLTAREREILELVAAGKTNSEIAAELWVAPSTVKKHLEHVYAKLGVGRRAGAVHRLRAQ